MSRHWLANLDISRSEGPLGTSTMDGVGRAAGQDRLPAWAVFAEPGAVGWPGLGRAAALSERRQTFASPLWRFFYTVTDFREGPSACRALRRQVHQVRPTSGPGRPAFGTRDVEVLSWSGEITARDGAGNHSPKGQGRTEGTGPSPVA